MQWIKVYLFWTIFNIIVPINILLSIVFLKFFKFEIQLLRNFQILKHFFFWSKACSFNIYTIPHNLWMRYSNKFRPQWNPSRPFFHELLSYLSTKKTTHTRLLRKRKIQKSSKLWQCSMHISINIKIFSFLFI